MIGGTAALGAIIGGIAGGGKGAAIGAASGAAVGTGAEVLTRRTAGQDSFGDPVDASACRAPLQL